MKVIPQSKNGLWILYALLILIITVNSCKEKPVEPMEEPPIYLCDVLGLGNMDQNRVGGDSFVFENNPNAPVDYVIECFPRILVDAKVEPGTVIEFGNDAGFDVQKGGSFSVVGTVNDTIIMRGTNSTKGWWRGIAFNEDDIRNELNYVIIDGAGGTKLLQGGLSAGVFNSTPNLKVSNATISNSMSYGLFNGGLGAMSKFENNHFSGNEDYPVVIHANDFGKLDGRNSTYTDNNPNMIQMTISGGSVITVTESQTWQNPGIPVIMDEGVCGILADLTIDPGFTWHMRADCHVSIDDKGSLKAVGTAAEPIVIRGSEAIQGFWTGIYLEGSNPLNELTYVTIEHGGREKPFGAAPKAANLYLASSVNGLSISNCTINESGDCGIFKGGATVSLDNISYANNAGGDVCE